MRIESNGRPQLPTPWRLDALPPAVPAAGSPALTGDAAQTGPKGRTSGLAETPIMAGDPGKGSTVGPVPLEGYNFDKLFNPTHQSVKYQFGRVASHYPLDSVQDKASAEALLKRMVPDLKAAGLDVVGVKGDLLQVKTELGYEWVDVIRGAGASKPGWQWGSEGTGTPEPTFPAGSSRLDATTSARPATAPAAGAPGNGSTVGPVPLEGYNSEKLANPAHQTVKYQFGRVASHYPLDSVQDKASAEALLKRMVPDLKAAGLDVVGVKGDLLQVKTELGYEWVDVIRGAGASKPGWQWGSEGTGTPEPTFPAGSSPVTPLKREPS